MITIVDYGIGNLGSIHNMLRKIGIPSLISSKADDLAAASKIILPGVGAFDTGMKHLRSSGLLDILNKRAMKDKIPVLGICLGAQLMTESSEEGKSEGLGWFKAATRRFNFDGLEGRWPLPNIGWRNVRPERQGILLDGFSEMPRFYFVHGYYLEPRDASDISMTSEYGRQFACGLNQGNLHCVQFHPEKSHKFGMQLLKNFAEKS